MPTAKPPKARRPPAKRESRAPKVRLDPMKEYAESISRDGGAQAVSLLDESCLSNVHNWVPTGSLALDRMLNGRGIPCGRITEIYGPNYIGKSTVLDMIFAQVQGQGGFGVLIDTESARDRNYTVSGLGVDPDKLQMLQFDEANQVNIESICNKIIESVEFWRLGHYETPIVIGWDSLGGVTTAAEMQKAVGERNVAAAAKAMRDGMRKMVTRLARSHVALVIINHQYTNIQTMGGRPTTRSTYAGDALRLAASIRCEMFHLGLIKASNGDVLGRQVGVRLDKNRFGACTETKIAVLSGRGVDNSWTLYEGLREAGKITVAGAWSTLQLPDTPPLKFMGWAALGEKCQQDPALFDRLVSLYTETKHADV